MCGFGYACYESFKPCFQRPCFKHLGKNVDVYIVDSGVNKHPAVFGNRVRWLENYTSHGWADRRDHGTRMASLIGGTGYGVSAKSRMYVYKTDSTKGIPEGENIQRALIAIAERNKRRKKGRRFKGAVINLSLDVPPVDGSWETVRTAIETLARQDIVIVMAAGNEKRDLKDFSKPNPCSWADTIISVGAVDKDHRLAEYVDGQGSNWWKHLTIFAPGKGLSGIDADGNERNDLEGTSAACAYVTGMVAAIMSEEKKCSATRAKKLLLLNALRGKIYSLLPSRGPNLLADKEFPLAHDAPYLGYRMKEEKIDELLKDLDRL